MERWSRLTIDKFSGPLDLLYNMVKEKKINIVDINLIEIANQYLDYLNSQQKLDIEIASEYLTMAAYLIELKSRMLLPQQEDALEDEGLSYQDFVDQLSRYEQIRTVSDFFAIKQEEYFKTYSPKKSKRKFNPQEIKEIENEGFDELGISISKFAEIYKKALKKHQKQLEDALNPIDDEFVDLSDFEMIENDILSPNEVSEIILNCMHQDSLKEWSIFEILTPQMFNLTNLISVFLAVLDLVKYQIVSVRQDNKNDDLLIRFTQYALENPEAVNGLEVENYE